MDSWFLILFNGLQSLSIIVYSDVHMVADVLCVSPLVLCPFDVPSLFIEHLLSIWQNTMHQLIWKVLAQPYIQPLLQGTRIAFSGERSLEVLL